MTTDNLDWDERPVYRQKVEGRIKGVAGGLELRRVRVLVGCGGCDDAFLDVVDDAKERGTISEEERRAALDIKHIVLRGENRQDQSVTYAVVGVAPTIEGGHVNRAAVSADGMRRATGEAVVPAVVGARIDEACRELAQERGVILIDVSFEDVKMIDVSQINA